MRVDPLSVINQLVEVCDNGERGFRRAAEAVRDPHLASVLLEYAAQREQFGSQLMYQVSRLGGRPDKHGTIAGVAHRRWIRVRAALGGHDVAIIEECARGDRHALQSYDRALGAQLPAGVRLLVEDQRIQIAAAHRHLADLQDEVCHGTT